MKIFSINEPFIVILHCSDMGLTKSENFTEDQNRKAAIFRALAHPARISILEVLIRKQACICNDLVDELPLSQSTVSQHLRELKEIGIIKGEIEGNSICYCINEKVWNEIRMTLSDFFKRYSTSNSCCN